jgi:hypothetical protein
VKAMLSPDMDALLQRVAAEDGPQPGRMLDPT